MLLKLKTGGLMMLFLLILGCNKPKVLLQHQVFSGQKLPEFTVIFFLSADCPMCKAYTPLVVSINDSIPQNWRAFIVLSDQTDGIGFKKGLFGMEIGDSSGTLARWFGATVNPEVILLNHKSEILYQGAIDNYAAETGKHRRVVSEHYLLDAIAKVKEGKKPMKAFTKPVGCYIE
jgi:thioredoxin-related protein